jgi:hypothetical protein
MGRGDQKGEEDSKGGNQRCIAEVPYDDFGLFKHNHSFTLFVFECFLAKAVPVLSDIKL